MNGTEAHTLNGKLQEAANTAQQLASLLDSMRQEAQRGRLRTTELEQRVQALESQRSESSELVALLRSSASSGVSADQMKSIAELLDALVQRPSDLLLLVKVSEEASNLARVVAEYSALREALAGRSSPA